MGSQPTNLAQGATRRGKLFIARAGGSGAVAEGTVAAAGELGEEVERLPVIWRSGEGERVGRRGVVGGRSGRRRGRRRPGWWRAAAALGSGVAGGGAAPWPPDLE